MKYSIAIIGSGSMGGKHTYGYDRINEFYSDMQIEKKVVCSRNITSERSKELGWSEYEKDWEKVVARSDIDVIDISTYDNLHYPIAKAALNNNKRVICEKPLANNQEQARELVKLAWGKSINCTVCMNYRYMHAVRCMKQLIESGELGQIRHIYGSFTMDSAVDVNTGMYWRFDDKVSPTGTIGDLGTHLIDLCRFIGLEFAEVGGMSEVYGKKRQSGSGFVETTASELCVFNARFNNGALGVFELSRVSSGGGMVFEIHGTKSSVRWEKVNINELLIHTKDMADSWSYKRINVGEIIPYDYKWNSEFIQNDGFTLLFHDFLSGGTPPTFSDGLKCAEIVDAILLSDKEKRTVQIS
ncbi:MAG: Gfo/Idh/MocA family oxidoreductase [Clostridiales bacterium]|jgi:predicted dehydrogenase|nr:Gfo/Idh/MocA family oxidoreductase [Clostridiales bacterium]